MPASEALGLALGHVGRDDEALAAFQKTLAREPRGNPPWSPRLTSPPRWASGRTRSPFGSAALAVNPWRSDYHAELALVYFDDGNWSAARDSSRLALDLRPSWVDVRERLARCYRHLGQIDACASRGRNPPRLCHGTALNRFAHRSTAKTFSKPAHIVHMSGFTQSCDRFLRLVRFRLGR